RGGRLALAHRRPRELGSQEQTIGSRKQTGRRKKRSNAYWAWAGWRTRMHPIAATIPCALATCGRAISLLVRTFRSRRALVVRPLRTSAAAPVNLCVPVIIVASLAAPAAAQVPPTVVPSDTWRAEASMPTARATLAVGVLNGILYALGGTNNAMTPLA